MKLTKNIKRINPSGLHYLDIAWYPPWLNELLDIQLNDPEMKELAKELKLKSKPGESVLTKLQRIQQFVHDNTYHLTPEDRVQKYGYISFDEIPYPRSIIDNTFLCVQEICNSVPGKEYRIIEWQNDIDKKRLWNCYCKSFTQRYEEKDMYRGAVPLTCSEEATLSAALAILTAEIPRENIVIFGSPIHICTFIRPVFGLKNGAIFDSKMLYLPKDMNKFGETSNEKYKNYMANRFGDLWFLVYDSGYIDLKNSVKVSKSESQVLEEISNFFSKTNYETNNQ